jgi:uncharacterized protein
MSRPVHFEVHAADPAKMQSFYQGLFGWTFEKWNGPMEYWIIRTGPKEEPGIDGGLVKRMGQPPIEGAAVNAYVCTMSVKSVDESFQKALDLGGTVAVPKMPIPGMGWLAYCKDPEGNIFGLMQNDPAAR